MRHRLFYHIVWTTRLRTPCIGLPLAEFLGRYLPEVIRRHDCTPLAVGIVSTHVHMLIRGATTLSIPKLLKSLKGGSARVARRELIERSELLWWAKGYSISSLGASGVSAVEDYVNSQARRHPAEAIPGWVPPQFGPSPPPPPPAP